MSRPKTNHSFQNDFSREDAVLRAESMFAKLDVNGDGDLTEVGNSQFLGIDELVEEELVEEDAKILIYLIQLYKYKYVIII